jgi:hypothetical protein
MLTPVATISPESFSSILKEKTKRILERVCSALLPLGCIMIGCEKMMKHSRDFWEWSKIFPIFRARS